MSDQLPADELGGEVVVEVSQEWLEVVRQCVLREMLLHKISYGELAKNLAKQGGEGFTPEALRERVERGDFSAGFLIRLLRAMGSDVLDLSSLRQLMGDDHE